MHWKKKILILEIRKIDWRSKSICLRRWRGDDDIHVSDWSTMNIENGEETFISRFMIGSFWIARGQYPAILISRSYSGMVQGPGDGYTKPS